MFLETSEGEHNHSFKKDKCCLSACLASTLVLANDSYTGNVMGLMYGNI